MKEETLEPNISSFIKSLRDIGYTFEIAVADILDNSIFAKAKNIEIHSFLDPQKFLCVLDDGIGQLIGMGIELLLRPGHLVELAGYSLHLSLDPLNLAGSLTKPGPRGQDSPSLGHTFIEQLGKPFSKIFHQPFTLIQGT